VSHAEVRNALLRDVRLRGVELVNVELDGELRNVVVNGVDIGPLVEAELARKDPDYAKMSPATADEFREAWGILERRWAETVGRARALDQRLLHESVDGEWSFVETLRHLVFATDAWAARTILDEPLPYHPLGLPHTGYPPADAVVLGIDIDARPSLAEVMEVRDTRMAQVRGIVEALTDASLERVCHRLPAPGYPEETRSVGRCLLVVMTEECEHRRYAVRDLATLEADPGG
jgi:DinB superfamily